MTMKITTKGFSQYKFVRNDKEWFEIFDIMSPDELIKCVKKCIQK